MYTTKNLLYFAPIYTRTRIDIVMISLFFSLMTATILQQPITMIPSNGGISNHRTKGKKEYKEVNLISVAK
jgi:hypothetical protein